MGIHGNARARTLIAAALLVLAALLAVSVAAGRRLADAEEEVLALRRARKNSAAHLEELRAARDAKARSAEGIKDSLTDLAKAKRAVYEAGLSLQEEKRLLEKTLEIMTTYILADETAGKIHLMRGDQILMSFPFSPPLRTLGNGERSARKLFRIVSKERYAYTERGKTETTAEGLQWTPPQIGRGRSASPLGEYVLFTDGPLILHAPAPDRPLHGSYPHLCAGLGGYSARRLYENVFIGTKLLIRTAPLKTKRTGRPQRSSRRGADRAQK